MPNTIALSMASYLLFLSFWISLLTMAIYHDHRRSISGAAPLFRVTRGNLVGCRSTRHRDNSAPTELVNSASSEHGRKSARHRNELRPRQLGPSTNQV